MRLRAIVIAKEEQIGRVTEREKARNATGPKNVTGGGRERKRVSDKTAGKWQKCNLFSGHGLCGQPHGLALNWMDRPRTSADERDIVWALRCRDCVWAVAGVCSFFHRPLVSS